MHFTNEIEFVSFNTTAVIDSIQAIVHLYCRITNKLGIKQVYEWVSALYRMKLIIRQIIINLIQVTIF